MSKRLLGKEVLSLGQFASKKNDGRAVLERVNVSKDYAEATDGRIAIRVPLPDEKHCEDFPINSLKGLGREDVFIPVDSLKKAFAGVQKKPALPILGNVLLGKESGKCCMVSNDLESENKVMIPKITDTFPDTHKFFNKDADWKKEGGLKITLSGVLLAKITDFAKKHGVNNEIDFVFYGEDKPVDFEIPIEVMGERTKAKGLLMPIKK